MAGTEPIAGVTRTGRLAVLVLSVVTFGGGVHPARVLAQAVSGRQLLVRLDAIASRAPSLQLGVGANVPTGLYVRVEGTLAAGAAWRRGQARAAGRADLAVRFLLDPFGESRVGLYGLGGLSAMYDGLERWRPRLLVGLGLEGRIGRRRVIAAELGLGGGGRLALVVRRARDGRR